MAFPIIFNILSLAEIFFIGYSIMWLCDLYFSNQTYIRDIFLIIASAFCILLNGVCNLNILDCVPIITMMIIQLNSMFLLTRVQSSKDKWKSNIYKAYSFFFSLYAIVSENWLVYLTSFTIILLVETLFSIKLEIEKSFILFNHLIYIVGFLCIYNYFQNKIGVFGDMAVDIPVLILSLLICAKTFFRIKQIKEYNI